MYKRKDGGQAEEGEEAWEGYKKKENDLVRGDVMRKKGEGYGVKSESRRTDDGPIIR